MSKVDDTLTPKPSYVPALVSLVVSSGNLICCALPAILVSLGMGAVMAGLIDSVPGILWFGKHKGLVLAVSAGMLAVAGIFQWRGRHAPCPADPIQARNCAYVRKVSWVLWWVSLALLAIGTFFSFGAVYFI